ncbi:hypothetical protein LTR65_007705 [Meristemomyces frigidus]
MAHASPSLVYGPVTEPLDTTTLGTLIETQARHYGNRTAVVFPEQQVRRTYRDLLFRSKLVAKALLHGGLQHGDCVGIMAGNCYEYIEVNVINDGRLIGERMQLSQSDVVCCPPPLFHCFGLVIGFLASFAHGSSIVFPSAQFDAEQVLNALVAEECTVLLGVPTMLIALMDLNRVKQLKITYLRTAVAAGAPVPQAVMRRMEEELGLRDTLNAYGMTETSPVTSMTSLDDSQERRVSSVGKVLAHTGAKIIDVKGNIVPRGVRGEICTSGFALQRGYWENEAKTAEVMKKDADGVMWMHTGDEGLIDVEGYLSITGRIKDLIIRGESTRRVNWVATDTCVGGENIFPAEIEDRLLAHPCIAETAVVGLPDERFGEAVACFLRQAEDTSRPKADDVAQWVQVTLGRHKAPKHVFWVGDADVLEHFPKTGSGKHQKHILRDIGARLLAQRTRPGPRAKL